MAKHDWEAMRRDYVEGTEIDGERKFPTFAQVGKKYRVPASKVRDRGATEGWSSLRSTFRAKVEHDRQEVRVAQLATAGAEFDSKCLVEANRAIAAGAEKLTQMLKRKADGEVDALEFKRLMDALRVAQLIGKVALGEAGGDESLSAPVPAGGGPALVRVTYERAPMTTDEV